MAYIFQCDCCGQREPEVKNTASFVIGTTWETERARIEVCEACKPLVEKELALFLRKVKHGNA